MESTNSLDLLECDSKIGCVLLLLFFLFSAKSWTESHSLNMYGCVCFYDYIRYVHISHMCVLPSEGRRGFQNSLELELLQIVYGYVGAGNQAQVFWNSSQCFYFLSSWVIIAHRYVSNESEWRWPKKHSYFKKKLIFWSSWLWYICYSLTFSYMWILAPSVAPQSHLLRDDDPVLPKCLSSYFGGGK